MKLSVSAVDVSWLHLLFISSGFWIDLAFADFSFCSF
jgi:hypothetical protein